MVKTVPEMTDLFVRDLSSSLDAWNVDREQSLPTTSVNISGEKECWEIRSFQHPVTLIAMGTREPGHQEPLSLQPHGSWALTVAS